MIIPCNQFRQAKWVSFALGVVVILVALGGGCGAGSSSPPASGGLPGSGGGSFQPRPFPGDYFMRLPNQDGGAWIPYGAYDQVLKELFVSNPAINAVEVYSTVDGHRVGEIGVPGPAGLSFSPGGTQLVIGTITPYVYFADPVALHIINRLPIPASVLAVDQQGNTLMPVMPYAMADGSLFLGMGGNTQSSSSASTFVIHLVRYDPGTRAFTPEDPGNGGGLANPVLSLDGKHLLTQGIGNSGLALFLYSTDSHSYVANSSTVQNAGTYLAANADGSQFVSVQEIAGAGSFSSEITFWNSSLQAGKQYTISGPVTSGVIYSRDGKFLYLMATNGTVVALNTQTGTPVGYIGLSIGSLLLPSPQFFDVDETYHLFGAVQPGGGLILNASQPQASPPSAIPLFIGPGTAANPNVGPLAGGTKVQFIPAPAASGGSADGISSSMEAYFGSTPATQDVVAPYPSSSNGGNFLTATAPAGLATGPVTALLTDANNNAVFLPDAYTYGPHVLRVTPNVASAQGGDRITIIAYGLGFFDLPDIHVSIGGTLVDMSTAVLNSYASTAYPEQSVTINVPPGTHGWADVTLSTSNGSDTLKRGLQYLKKKANLPGGPFSFALYDSVRDHFYLTGSGNGVAVFDPGTQTFLQPLNSPAISAGAVLQGEALTPDNSKLLAADPSDQTVIVFDLVANTSNAVKVILPSDPPTTLSGPMTIAASAGMRAFISLTPCIRNPVREINLTTLTVQARPDASSSCATYVPYPKLGASSADGSTIIFAANNGLQPPGPEYLWRYDASADSFSGPVLVADAPWLAGEAAVDSDGGVIALSQGTLDQRLLPLVPLAQGGLDSRLNDTGSLLYTAYNSILISDTRNGRQLLTLVLPASIGPYRPLAINPPGDKILVATQAGISYFELGVVPLSVGTVSPGQAAAGADILIRGSGFDPASAVQIGGKSATCTGADSQTLSCTVPNLPKGPVSMTLTNPDGQVYSFEDAFSLP